MPNPLRPAASSLRAPAPSNAATGRAPDSAASASRVSPSRGNDTADTRVLLGADHFDGVRRRADAGLAPTPLAPTAHLRPPEPTRVMGLTERQALLLSGDPDGSAFSAKHTQGDPANRWSHAAVAKTVDLTLQAHGVPKVAAALAGASVFAVKEYCVDMKPSPSDLVLADFEVYNSGKPGHDELSVGVSVFGDGAVFLSVTKTF